MLIRWLPRHEAPLRYPLVAYVSKRLRDEEQTVQRWEVAIYPPSVRPGAPPTVVVDVPADTRLPVAQPIMVEVAGRLEAGAAVALRLPRGDVAYGLSPARPAFLLRRRRFTN
jgi:hypothetical protein